MHITLDEVNAWAESTKLDFSAGELDEALERHVSTQIISRLRGTFDVSTWVDDATTPKLVRTLISMLYMAWYYDKHYSDDAEANAYAQLLRETVEANILGLLSGDIILEEFPDANIGVGTPSFFPTDASSSRPSSSMFPSDGPPVFTMGSVF